MSKNGKKKQTEKNPLRLLSRRAFIAEISAISAATLIPENVIAQLGFSLTSNTGRGMVYIPTGRLYTVGSGFLGQLGHGDLTNRSYPANVGFQNSWRSVSAGNYHTMAIKNDNTLWAWGSGASGRLGLGDTATRSSPVQVGALSDWWQVSASPKSTTFAIKADGTLWGWGYNVHGQLGNGNTTPRSSPAQLGALTNWSQISVGGLHVLAIKTDGTLWGWGRNAHGQIGDSTLVDKSSPVQIGALTNWMHVSAGYYHVAALKNVEIFGRGAVINLFSWVLEIQREGHRQPKWGLTPIGSVSFHLESTRLQSKMMELFGPGVTAPTVS